MGSLCLGSGGRLDDDHAASRRVQRPHARVFDWPLVSDRRHRHRRRHPGRCQGVLRARLGRRRGRDVDRGTEPARSGLLPHQRRGERLRLRARGLPLHGRRRYCSFQCRVPSQGELRRHARRLADGHVLAPARLLPQRSRVEWARLCYGRLERLGPAQLRLLGRRERRRKFEPMGGAKVPTAGRLYPRRGFQRHALRAGRDRQRRQRHPKHGVLRSDQLRRDAGRLGGDLAAAVGCL